MFFQQYTYAVLILAFVGSSFAGKCGSGQFYAYPITNYGVESRLLSQYVNSTCDGFVVFDTSFTLTVPTNNTYLTSASTVLNFFSIINSSYELLELMSQKMSYLVGASGTYTYQKEYVVDYCASFVQRLEDPFNLTSNSFSFGSLMNTTISTTDMRNGTGPNITEIQVNATADNAWEVVPNVLSVTQSQTIFPRSTGYQPYRFKIAGLVNSDRAKIVINLSGTFNTENASFGPVVYVGSTPCYKNSENLHQLSPSSSIQELNFSVEVASTNSWIYLIFEAPNSEPTSTPITVNIKVSDAPPVSPVESAPMYKLWWFWVAIVGGLAMIAGVAVIVVVRRRNAYQSIA